MTRMIMMTMAKINYGACARIGARQQWEQLNVVWVKMAIIWLTDVSLAWIKEAYIENMSLVDLLQNFKLHLPGVFKEVRMQRRTRQKICTDILVNCTDILVIHTDTFFCPKKMVFSGSDMPSANHDVVLLTAVVLTRIQTWTKGFFWQESGSTLCASSF